MAGAGSERDEPSDVRVPIRVSKLVPIEGADLWDAASLNSA
jgi:hypothetical protein